MFHRNQFTTILHIRKKASFLDNFFTMNNATSVNNANTHRQPLSLLHQTIPNISSFSVQYFLSYEILDTIGMHSLQAVSFGYIYAAIKDPRHGQGQLGSADSGSQGSSCGAKNWGWAGASAEKTFPPHRDSEPRLQPNPKCLHFAALQPEPQEPKSIDQLTHSPQVFYCSVGVPLFAFLL